MFNLFLLCSMSFASQHPDGELPEPSPFPTPAPSEAGVEGGRYRIVVSNGMCADVMSAANEQGADLIQWPCHGGGNQTFIFESRLFGAMRIRVEHSGQCLDIERAAKHPNADVVQWACHDGANQSFSVEPQADGYWIRATHSGLCLRTVVISEDPGLSLVQGRCDEGAIVHLQPAP